MSAQMALMAGSVAMTAMSAGSSIAAGNSQAAGFGSQAWGALVNQAGYQAQAAETGLQTSLEERQRRVGLARLLSANRADIAGRGVDSGQGTSFDVIEDYNVSETAKEIDMVRFMGENRQRRLSFAADDAGMKSKALFSMSSQAAQQGWFNALRTIGGAALSAGFSMGGFGGASTPNIAAGSGTTY